MEPLGLKFELYWRGEFSFPGNCAVTTLKIKIGKFSQEILLCKPKEQRPEGDRLKFTINKHKERTQDVHDIIECPSRESRSKSMQITIIALVFPTVVGKEGYSIARSKKKKPVYFPGLPDLKPSETYQIKIDNQNNILTGTITKDGVAPSQAFWKYLYDPLNEKKKQLNEAKRWRGDAQCDYNILEQQCREIQRLTEAKTVELDYKHSVSILAREYKEKKAADAKKKGLK